MKYLIPILSLFIICFPGKILGAEKVNLTEPVHDVISKSYKKVCHFKRVCDEMKALVDYIIKVGGTIRHKLADHKSKQEDVLLLMCQNDTILRSSVESLIKEMCEPNAPQYDIVKKIIEQTCSCTVPQMLDVWHKGKTVHFNIVKEN